MCGCGILEQRWKRTRGVASVASEDDIVSVQLTADQIMLCAYTICHAASPPLPACGPDVSVEDQVRQATDWLLDSDYEDAHLCIAIGGAWAANNRQRGVEVAIRLQPAHADEADHRQNETDDGTVFVGYELFDIGKVPRERTVCIRLSYGSLARGLTTWWPSRCEHGRSFRAVGTNGVSL